MGYEMGLSMLKTLLLFSLLPTYNISLFTSYIESRQGVNFSQHMNFDILLFQQLKLFNQMIIFFIPR